MMRSQSTDLVPMEIYTSYHHYNSNSNKPQQPETGAAVKVGGNLTGFVGSTAHSPAQQYFLSGLGIEPQPNADSVGTTTTSAATTVGRGGNNKKIVKQYSTASQQSTSSTSSSVQSAPPTADYRHCVHGRGYSNGGSGNQSPARWSSHERVTSLQSLYGGVAIGSHNSLGFLQPQLQSTHFSSNPTPASASTSAVATSHGDIDVGLALQHHVLHKPQRPAGLADEDGRSTSSETNFSANANNISSGSNAVDTAAVDTKKRRRRLRFPFGNSSSSGGGEGNNGRKAHGSNKSGKMGKQN